MVRQLALQVGQLARGRAQATQLGGHGGGQQAGVAKCVERLGHEAAFDVVAAGVLGEHRRDGGGAVEEGLSVRGSSRVVIPRGSASEARQE